MNGIGYGYDYTYLIYILPALILSLIAQIMVKSRFSRFDKVKSEKGITGAQAAMFLLKENGITDVKVTHISGSLTDNYNPTNKTLSLSDSTYSSTSIAAIGVAAHETGHAIQHHVGYKPLNMRKAFVPAANLGSRFGPALVVIGILLGSFGNFGAQSNNAFLGQISEWMTLVGIGLFSLSVLFYLITLPVEFNASNRALKILKKTSTFNKSELHGARKVLSAAAMTYVAAALSAIGSMLRLISIAKRNRR